VNDGEVFDGDGGDGDAGRAGDVDGKGREEGEGEMAHGVAKLGAIRAVPGVDGIERCKLGETRFRARVLDDSDEIEIGIGDGADTIGKLIG
jgi:hypothetical protein